MTAKQNKNAPSELDLPRSYTSWTALRYWLVWAYDGAVPQQAHEGDYGLSSHPEFSCWLIRKGYAVVEANGHTVKATPGQWIFVATDRRHQKFSSDIEILSLRLHLSWPSNEPVIEQEHSYVLDADNHPELERMALPLIRSVRSSFPQAKANLHEGDCSLLSYLRVQNLLPRWLSIYLKIQLENGIHPKWLEVADPQIQQTMMELDRQPLNKAFSAKSLSASIGLSQSRLNARFVQSMGMTPKRYFENRRLDAAKQLLANTSMSIKEVAFNLGFLYDSHFTHWFSKKGGCTPSDFRNRGKRRTLS
jgi:AraC-like DNA-binding protein